MCVIAVKNRGVAFPQEEILRNCWDNNPNMGGFMYSLNEVVYIQKGYKTWESFINALNEARRITGDDIPYVLHFRISTQGYSTDCCQPFPLSSKMKSLKKSRTQCSIGVAHNGVIDFTSDGAKDYSDTMKFITDILVHIIRGFDWYKEPRNIKLIENLIEGSRFAILDKFGHTELLGKTWVEDGGVYYSNSSYSYSYKRKSYSFGGHGVYDYDDWWDDYYGKAASVCSGYEYPNKTRSKVETLVDEYEDFKIPNTNEYMFDESYCPYVLDEDDSYCKKCSNKDNCTYLPHYRAVGGVQF